MQKVTDLGSHNSRVTVYFSNEIDTSYNNIHANIEKKNRGGFGIDLPQGGKERVGDKGFLETFDPLREIEDCDIF